MPKATARTPRRILLAGATGLVGQQILRALLVDDTASTVHVLVRRPLETVHPKLTTHVVDFTALPTLPEADELYLALGTTIKVAGSQTAFRAVDVDANLAVARAAVKAGATRLGLVSAMGADPHSRIFYNRVKGELEAAVVTLGFDAVVLARPSLLLGERGALRQAARPGERMSAVLAGVLRPLIPADYRPIRASDVAHALLAHVPQAHGNIILRSGAMQATRS